jgi:ABC-2 type transport system permease protein/lipopolysaccharide transport system permease protein
LSLSPGLPDFGLIFQSLLGGIIILGIGWTCFRLWRHLFMDLL